MAGVEVEIIGKIPKVYLSKKPHEGGFLDIRAIAYACKYLSGQVSLGEQEHVNYKWMDFEEAKKKVWLKQGEELIEQAIKIYDSSK